MTLACILPLMKGYDHTYNQIDRISTEELPVKVWEWAPVTVNYEADW